LQQVQTDVTQNRHVLRCVIFADTTGIFVHTHIQPCPLSLWRQSLWSQSS
jgi:hypothetical protein